MPSKYLPNTRNPFINRGFSRGSTSSSSSSSSSRGFIKSIRDLVIAFVIILALLNLTRLRNFSKPDTAIDITPYYEINAENAGAGGADLINEVITVDDAALKNTRATLESAHARVEWGAPAVGRPESNAGANPSDNLNKFQVIPLSATVDRRPLIVKKQMVEDDEGLHSDGSLLGCAMSATTFVSNLANVHLKHYKESKNQPHCDVCFQFSNREDMDNFVPGVGYEPLQTEQSSVATKCFGGQASITARFSKWQQTDDRFTGFGYPFTVDCSMPNGIKELTCREISKMQKQINVRDDLQAIHFRTRISLEGWFEIWAKQIDIHTYWPWTALMSHDDDRSKIADDLPEFWNDGDSKYVPHSYDELQLAHVEGPVYDKTAYKKSLSLRSMLKDEKSNGGVHFRLVINLFHLIRNAPDSTHIIAVVDGQLNRTVSRILGLLHMKVGELYPEYGTAVFSDVDEMKRFNLIPIKEMEKKSKISFSPDLTLMELLHIRGINILVVPIPTPSIVFERSVCGGQYAFAPYLAARYAADYQVMMFIDGDTAMIEREHTLQQVLFNRFFSKHGTKCAGHRLRLIEQYVKPEFDNTEKVLQCTHDLVSDKAKWKYAMENCHLKEGHIVARTDSIFAFSVHHPDTLTAFTPRGIEDCISSGNIENDRYFLKESEFVQLHLRDRERKPECSCFVNHA